MDCKAYESSKNAVLNRDSAQAVTLSKAAVAANDGSAEQILQGIRDALIDAAERFDSGIVSMARMTECSVAAKDAFDALSPYTDGIHRPKVILATIEGDRHSQGKDLIRLELSGLGFDVIDLGTDVPVDTIVRECVESEAEAVVTSAIITSSLQHLKTLEDRLRSAGIRDRLITCIGGPPTSQAWADRIGADIWSRNSSGCMKSMLESFPSMK